MKQEINEQKKNIKKFMIFLILTGFAASYLNASQKELFDPEEEAPLLAPATGKQEGLGLTGDKPQPGFLARQWAKVTGPKPTVSPAQTPVVPKPRSVPPTRPTPPPHMVPPTAQTRVAPKPTIAQRAAAPFQAAGRSILETRAKMTNYGSEKLRQLDAFVLSKTTPQVNTIFANLQRQLTATLDNLNREYKGQVFDQEAKAQLVEKITELRRWFLIDLIDQTKKILQENAKIQASLQEEAALKPQKEYL